MTHMEKLLSIASAAILESSPELPSNGACLREMLARKNGFYAFESALHVFCAGVPVGDRGLEEWNSDLWQSRYDGIPPHAVFFAEDIFGAQFCLMNDSISTFDPETGAFESMATSLEEWAGKILDDYEVLTGHPLAHEWQVKNGALPSGHRLVPKIPFVLGGPFSVDNVHLLDAVKGMHYRASIARQIRDLPDGASVTLEVAD